VGRSWRDPATLVNLPKGYQVSFGGEHRAERWKILKAVLGASAGENHKENSPVADAVRMVKMIDSVSKQAQLELRCRLPENFSTKEIDIVRARELSRQI
jgi:hypothetical protein